MNKCEKRFGFIKFDEMTRVKVLLLAVNSKRRKHLNSEDSEARFKVWYTFRTLSGDSGITVWSFEDRSSVPGPERWGLCNVKFHQNGDTVPLTALWRSGVHNDEYRAAIQYMKALCRTIEITCTIKGTIPPLTWGLSWDSQVCGEVQKPLSI